METGPEIIQILDFSDGFKITIIINTSEDLKTV